MPIDFNYHNWVETKQKINNEKWNTTAYYKAFSLPPHYVKLKSTQTAFWLQLGTSRSHNQCLQSEWNMMVLDKHLQYWNALNNLRLLLAGI